MALIPLEVITPSITYIPYPDAYVPFMLPITVIPV